MSRRITIVGKYPPIQGGVSASVYWTSLALARDQHEVQVVTNAEEVETEFRIYSDGSRSGRSRHGESPNNLNVNQISPIKKGSYVPWSIPFVSRLLGLTLKVVEEHNSDLILGWYFEPYGIVAALAGSILNKPIAIRHAGSDVGRLSLHRDLKTTYGWMLSTADHVLSSPGMENRLCDLGARSERIHRITASRLPRNFSEPSEDLDVLAKSGNFRQWAVGINIDAGLIESIDQSNQKEFDRSKPTICCYGKVGKTKGSFAILAALDKFANQGVEFNFVSVACGHASTLEAYYRSFLAADRLTNQSWLLPPMPPWEIPSLLKIADISLFLENRFPIVFHAPKIPREILASGSCLVCSREIIIKHPFRESFVDGKNVVIVDDPEVIDDLAGKINQLVSDPVSTSMIAKHGKYLSEFIEDHLPAKHPVSSFLESI